MSAKSVPMQYEDKFHALARAVEVTEEEMQIAKFFWYAGLRHAFQRGTSSPALLEKPISIFDMKFGTDSNLQKYPSDLSEDVQEYVNSVEDYSQNDRVLTPHEAKLMQLILSAVLSDVQEGIKGLQTYINFIWKDCDPADKRTEETFKEMNKLKDIVRKSKKHVATLNNAQRKLKKMAKGT